MYKLTEERVKSKHPKSQNELENAVDEVLQNLSLNVVQSCIKKTQEIYQQFVSLY